MVPPREQAGGGDNGEAGPGGITPPLPDSMVGRMVGDQTGARTRPLEPGPGGITHTLPDSHKPSAPPL